MHRRNLSSVHVRLGVNISSLGCHDISASVHFEAKTALGRVVDVLFATNCSFI
jgi:hypothetical protein